MCKDLIQIVNDGEMVMDNDKNGYVYIIENENNLVKIGKSRNPVHRINTLEKLGGNKIINVYITELCSNYSQIEHKMHIIFRNKRKIGEWFNLDFKDAVSKVNTLKLEKAKYLTKEEKRIENEKLLSLMSCFEYNIEGTNNSDFQEKIKTLLEYTQKLMDDSLDKSLLIKYIETRIENITKKELELIKLRLCIMINCESWEKLSMHFINKNLNEIDKCIDATLEFRKITEQQLSMFDGEVK